jgi:pimeloyl-ACP methyl ester carboxylesterase
MSKASVLFVHSTGLGPFMWKAHLAALPGSFAGFAPANLGYPPSALLPRDQAISAADEVTHLLGFVTSAVPPDQPLHLAAHSYGGLVALELALQMSQKGRPPASLWLYEPVLFGSLMHSVKHGATVDEEAKQQAVAFEADPTFLNDLAAGGTEPWLQRFVDYWNHAGAWAAMPDKARANMLALGWKMFLEVCSVWRDSQPFDAYKLASSIPITLAHGSTSPAASRAMIKALAEVNPHANVQGFDGIGHSGLIADARVVASLQNHLAQYQSR